MIGPPILASRTLVACNIYVSAGGGGLRHAQLLLQLLDDAQQWCRRGGGTVADDEEDGNHHGDRRSSSGAALRVAEHRLAHDAQRESSSPSAAASSVRVVHAFADRVYDRSSFHLAGEAPAVVHLASHLASEALAALSSSDDDAPSSGTADGFANLASAPARDPMACHPHPCVGLVDHIAVMPLVPLGGGPSNSSPSVEATPCVWAAHRIGHFLERRHPQLRVLYYGDAHPQGLSLAQVRRGQTSFFKSQQRLAPRGAADAPPYSSSSPPPPLGIVTVGAPSTGFGENVNMRLRPCLAGPGDDSSSVGREHARSLARHVRSRDGGLPHVEALALPYSGGRWEVACNLLIPAVTSADDVVAAAREWESSSAAHGRDGEKARLERCYRVGTTAQMCWEALALASLEQLKHHDNRVREGFLDCLTNDT